MIEPLVFKFEQKKTGMNSTNYPYDLFDYVYK
ncbi:hypothetical protein IX296_001380 [Bacteroides pyogenes]|nr:hypothetical protein [Bacteroides pyogenes]MBR8725196.1 hypothetical protein [Bacteroides pyogenes]MBR8738615.1 hypothetical protein [Bacteroides pyogenes]MBR8754357.1 hypothetical protein [Bacteroides pyogenes]MBR8795784.1 hypothetical protein [Bacteroides pyogenes]